jgi:hypothetical protein
LPATRARILILSTTTGYQLRSFGGAAAELGVDVIFATDRCHALDDPWRDSAIPVRFHDEDASVDAVCEAARERPIDAVMAVGDRPVVLAARIAAALGVAGNPVDAARASVHKRLARARFEAAGLPVPWHVSVTIGSPLDGATAAPVDFPAVVKPVSLSGSRGVIRVNDRDQLAAAVGRVAALMARPDIRAQRTGAEDELLIERFIPGREYALEGLLTRGVLQPLALFDKPDPLDGPFFEETIYVTPSGVSPSIEGAIVTAVARAAEALGLAHGPVHAECRVNDEGVFVLEVAARPIGGLCSRVLRFENARTDDGSTSSLEHVLLRHACGDDVSMYGRERRAAAVMMIPIPRRGVLKSVTGEEEARAVRCVEDVQITAKRDHRLEPLPEAGSYLGFIFARADQPRDAEAAVRDAHAKLTFEIGPTINVKSSREF